MKALYTETFKEFLINNADNSMLSALKNRIESTFPSFKFSNSETLSFFDILESKYQYREIGYETEDLFFASLNRKVDESGILYKDKISMVASKFPELLSHKLTMGEEEKYTDYLNPTVATIPDLNPNAVAKRERTHEVLTGFVTNDVALVQQFQELKSIYYTAIESFDTCFMGCF